MSFINVFAETDGRSMQIVIPEQSFEESLYAIAAELGPDFTWRAERQESIELGRSAP